MGFIGTLIDFVSGTKIVSADIDQNFADIRTAFNESAVLTDVDKTIEATHTFNPPAGAPFLIGADAADELVAGLNAEKVGGSTLAQIYPDRHVAADQAAMLALVAKQGDIAYRTDESAHYFLTAAPASTLANWASMSGGAGFNPVANRRFS